MIRMLKTYWNYATLLCFIFTCLIVNVAQVICFILVRPFSVDLSRKLNHNLQHLYWSQTVAIVDWNSNVRCRLYFKDEKTFEAFRTMPALVVANHRYDIDWLASWMIADKFYRLGSGKAMMKSSLKYVPVVGWASILSDMIYLSRNWDKDKEKLKGYTQTLLTYHDPLILGYFEGTRFTQAKYEASQKFAEERNLPIRLKHHLIPRTRGFNCMVRQIRESIEKNPKLKMDIFNLEVALENDDNSKASLSSVLTGQKTGLYMYIERIDVNDIPIDDEDATSQYLFDVYKKKDQLFDYFLANKRFPGLEKPYKPRLINLINWIFWMLFNYSTLIYLYYRCFTSGSLTYIMTMSTLALGAIYFIRMLVNTTKVSKSSSYGTKTASKTEKVQ